jgi:hypothetical protein
VYYVSVRKWSGLGYKLEPCPVYYGSLLGGSRADQFQLNCGPVGHIAPDSAVRTVVHWHCCQAAELSNWSLADCMTHSRALS